MTRILKKGDTVHVRPLHEETWFSGRVELGTPATVHTKHQSVVIKLRYELSLRLQHGSMVVSDRLPLVVDYPGRCISHLMDRNTFFEVQVDDDSKAS